MRHSIALAAALLIASLNAFASDGALPLKGAMPRVFCGSNPPTWLLCSVAPEALCAWNFAPTQSQLAFLPESLAKLPAIGGWNMHGLNMESLLALKPDFVLVGEGGRGESSNAGVLSGAGIPVRRVKLDVLEDYPAAFRSAGALCGRAERGEALAASFERSLADLKALRSAIPSDGALTVYYACGPEGLETAAGEALHVQVIGYAGAKNAFSKGIAGKGGRFKVSLEQVLAANPDHIVVRDRLFFENVFKDPRWAALAAVKAKRVHLIPGAPLNWFDRPPSFMQLLGSWWLFSVLHPDVKEAAWRSRAESFYREFLQVDLDAAKWALIETPKEDDERLK